MSKAVSLWEISILILIKGQHIYIWSLFTLSISWLSYWNKSCIFFYLNSLYSYIIMSSVFLQMVITKNSLTVSRVE